jgi:hypothetical protein
MNAWHAGDDRLELAGNDWVEHRAEYLAGLLQSYSKMLQRDGWASIRYDAHRQEVLLGMWYCSQTLASDATQLRSTSVQDHIAIERAIKALAADGCKAMQDIAKLF